jgi:hypothetical protein
VSSPRSIERFQIPTRWLGPALVVAYAAVVAIYLVSGLGMESWDDSYFFKRIGLNLLEHGALAWNVADGPVYGNTSQGFQLVALLPLLIDPEHYVSMIKLLSAAWMVLLFGLYVRAARKLLAEATASDLALAWSMGFLGACAPFLLLLIHSGMETALALVLLAVNLIVIRHAGRTGRDSAAVVVTTVLVYLTRPDAVLISVLSLAGYHWLRDRKLPWRLLAYCGAALLVTLGLLWLYFGTPLPLSFYLKSSSFTVYTDQFIERSLKLKHRNIAGLLVMTAPLVYVVAHGRSAWSWVLAGSFAVFNAYHFFSTVEVMGYYARFYIFSMVPLTLAAIDAAPHFRARSRLVVSLLFCALYLALVLFLYRQRLIFDAKDAIISRVPQALYVGYVIAAAIVLLGARIHAGAVAALIAIPVLVGGVRGLPLKAPRLRTDEALLSKHIDRFTTVRGIRSVRACLPEPLHMYHSEIGIPGVMFQRSTVTDMAGLMDENIAFQGMDFDARCMADRPEVLFMPHKVYDELRKTIDESQCIRGYRRVVRDSSSPLYIREDLAPDFLACARQQNDRWIDAK